MPLQQVVQASFLPTIVVGIGDAGKAASEQFIQLLAGLDEFRRACVAVLAVEEGELVNGEIAGSWFEPPAPSGDQAAPEKKPLADLLFEAISGTQQGIGQNAAPRRRGVREAPAIQKIAMAGYTVPDNMMAVVWVVAPTESDWLAPVVQELRSTLSAIEQQRQQSRSWIMLALLSRYPEGSQKAYNEQRKACAAQPWDKLLVGVSGEEPLATFAYLFETRDEKNDFWQHVNDLPFAAAEAIFLFTVSGMGTTDLFKPSLKLTLEGSPVTRAPLRMGSIGSTRLQFPRDAAERFCAYRLGSAIMQEWIPEKAEKQRPQEKLANQLTAQESNEQEAAAQEFIRNLERFIDDTDELPRGGPGGRPSPRLSDGVVAQAKGLKGPLTGSVEPIFHLLQRKQLEVLVTGRRDLADVMAVQYQKAKDELRQWKNWVRKGWDAARQRSESDIATRANNLIFEPARGAAKTRVFLDKLHEALKTKQERMAGQRDLREERLPSGKDDERREGYRIFLARMADLDADGPWEADIPSYQPGTITAVGPAPWIQPGASPAGGPPPVVPPSGKPPEPPPRSWEEEIEERLKYRYKCYKRQQPSIGALIGAGLLVLPVFLMLVLALFPAQTLPTLLTAMGISLGGIVVASILYRLYRHRQAVQAGEDLRRFYIRVLTHQCERFEDQWRDLLMVSFIARVRKMIDRLTDWNTFLEQTAAALDQEARTIEQELFTGAVGRRDVLLANKAIMSLEDYNLTAFEREVTQQRMDSAKAAPEDAWMASTPGILPRMLNELRTTNLLEASSRDLLVPIRDFCQKIVRRYLTSPLRYLLDGADGQIALPGEINKSKPLITYLLEHPVILYSPADPPPTPLVFLIGRQRLLQSITRQVPSGDMLGISTKDDEWIGAIRLLPGGATPPFSGAWATGAGGPVNVASPETWQ